MIQPLFPTVAAGFSLHELPQPPDFIFVMLGLSPGHPEGDPYRLLRAETQRDRVGYSSTRDQPGSIYPNYVCMYYSHRVSVMPVRGRNRAGHVTHVDEPLTSATSTTEGVPNETGGSL